MRQPPLPGATMRVIVAGAGIGGLAAALALTRAGARVQVLERAPALGEAGAGLQLAPNATRLLFAMGLEAELRRIAFAPASADIYDRASGRRLLSTPLGDHAVERWGSPYLQAHRADLHAVLLAACEAAGVRLRVASPVGRFEADTGGVRVQAGGETMTADMLVGADGVHSRVRTALIGETPARFTGQVAWRGLVAASDLPAGLIAEAATVWTSAGSHFVHYFVRGGTLVNFVGFTPARAWTEESWTTAAAPGEVARAFEGWPAPVQALVAAQARAEQNGWRSAVYDRPAHPGWASGRVALLGDAAHPMVPYLAQGAGMAIEDAEALRRHLGASADPALGLQAYARERYPRVRKVQAWAARNGAVFHLPGPLRRAAFAAAALGDASARLDWLYGYAPPAADASPCDGGASGGAPGDLSPDRPERP